MILEARVSTVEAMDPTVYVEALASRCMVKFDFSLLLGVVFSSDTTSSSSSAQFSCSYCCLRGLIQYLHTRYVAMAITATPPMTPPAMAPTFGLLFDVAVGVMVSVDGVTSSFLMQDVEGHDVQERDET